MNHRPVSRHTNDGSMTSYTTRSRAVPSSSRRSGRPVSRHGGKTPSTAVRRVDPVICNRCRKPLTCSVYIVTCNCIFCSDCAEEHFKSSTECPCCKKAASSNDDFLQLNIADPIPRPKRLEREMQGLVTKGRPAATSLEYSDMAHDTLQSYIQSRRKYDFVQKQLMMKSGAVMRQCMEAERQFKHEKEQNVQMKQAISRERLENEQQMTNLESQLSGMAAKLKELKEKAKEKDQKLYQYRTRVGGSAHSMGSASSAPRSLDRNRTMMQRQQLVHRGRSPMAPQTTPIQIPPLNRRPLASPAASSIGASSVGGYSSQYVPPPSQHGARPRPPFARHSFR